MCEKQERKKVPHQNSLDNGWVTGHIFLDIILNGRVSAIIQTSE